MINLVNVKIITFEVPTINYMSIRTFLLIIGMIPLRIYAQTGDAGALIQVQQLAPLNISYDNIDALMQDVKVDNAFQVTVLPQKSKCYLYAQLVFTEPNSTTPAASGLRLKTRTINGITQNTVDMPLSLTPIQISEIEPSLIPTTLNYDVVIKSQQNMSNIGLHNFSINFSIVQL